MWILNPLWSTVVGAHRLRITPPELRARILSIATLISGGPVPLASVAAGVLLETAGTTPTVIVFSAIMVVGAAIAVVGSRAVRDAPPRPLPFADQSENV
jgi:VIT1/CCC1 family predicted Fe2+/Mn2+ transporter